MRKAVFGLGFFLLIACGSSDPENSGLGTAAASGGEDASGGGAGESESGSAGKAGGSGTSTGGTATGASSSGGAYRGGSDQGGTLSSGGNSSGGTGGSGAVGGPAAASGGMGGMATAGTSGRSGSGGNPADPVCDPVTGELDNTPYPDCEPRDASDPCELCIQASCCEESKVCYGFDPANVCGWGGPTYGTYAGYSELDCYVACARAYVGENGVYDDSAADLCVPMCTTAECGLIGNATQDLVVCLEQNCENECFVP